MDLTWRGMGASYEQNNKENEHYDEVEEENSSPNLFSIAFDYDAHADDVLSSPEAHKTVEDESKIKYGGGFSRADGAVMFGSTSLDIADGLFNLAGQGYSLLLDKAMDLSRFMGGSNSDILVLEDFAALQAFSTIKSTKLGAGGSFRGQFKSILNYGKKLLNNVAKRFRGGYFVKNRKGIQYPIIKIEGYGKVPLPEGPYTPNNSKILRGKFTPALKKEFKENWISQGKPWPVGNINIHHIKPLSRGGDNSSGNLVPLVQPEQHQPFTNWWRSYP